MAHLRVQIQERLVLMAARTCPDPAEVLEGQRQEILNIMAPLDVNGQDTN